MSHRLVFVAVMLAVAMPALAGDVQPARRREPEPDTALVHFLRPGRWEGAVYTMFLYSDREFLGVLDNRTTFAARMTPGQHLLWVHPNPEGRTLDLRAGQTYYCLLDVGHHLALLDAAQGETLLAQIGREVTPLPRERKTAARRLAKRYAH